MRAPYASGLSVELLLRVIDVKYSCFTLLFAIFKVVTCTTVTQGLRIQRGCYACYAIHLISVIWRDWRWGSVLL